MRHNINNLAVEIMEKIIANLPPQVKGESTDSAPFRHGVREGIYNTLLKYMEEYTWEIKESPMQLAQMPISEVEQYIHSRNEKMATELVVKTLNNPEFFEKWTFDEEGDLYRCERRNIVVLKTGKLSKASKA